jgi:outer membrane protein assembly factor BamB
MAATGWAQDWPRFRGPNGTGVSDATGLVAEFSTSHHVVWKAEVAAGTSSPIVVGNRLFYCSYGGDRRTVHCLDAGTGRELWNRSITKARDELATPPNDPATPTPASDGSRVVAFFPDFGILAYTVDGEPMWSKEYPPSTSMHGLASSLVIVGNKVIHQVDQLKDSYLAAYHVHNGELAWRVERLSGVTGGYSTPATMHPASGPAQVIVDSPLEMAAFRADTGEKLWWLTGKSNAPIGCPAVTNDQIYFCEPEGEPIPFSMVASMDKDSDGRLSLSELKDEPAASRLFDRIDENRDQSVDEAEWNSSFGTFVGRGGLIAVDPSGAGDITATHVKWSITKSVPHIPSVLVYQGVLYFVQDGGIVTSVDPGTGEVAKRARLSESTGQYYASPVAADGKIYLANTDGNISVLRAGREWEVLSTNKLGEACYATPVIANNCLFIRCEKSIYCFGEL